MAPLHPHGSTGVYRMAQPTYRYPVVLASRSSVRHIMQGESKGMIKYNGHFAKMHASYTNNLNEFILSIFCCTVDRIERDIDGKLFSIIEATGGYVLP